MPTRPFKTCVSTLGCPDLSLSAVLDLAERFNIDCLELRSLDNRIDLPAYLSEQPGGVEAARKALNTLDCGAVALGTSHKLVDPKDGSLEELLAFAQLAEELDTPYLRVFGGGKWGTPLTEENFKEAIDFLNWWQAKRAEENWNVDILIETHDAFSASAPLLELFSRLGRSVGIIWDTHHTWKLGRETPAESWNQLGSFTRHVHIKDSISQPSARHPYTYVLPGSGEMPLDKVYDILYENNFTGSVALEWEKMWHPYLVDISEALSACQKNPTWSGS
ncbi:MAG TPA: sugar phosphate isomerase/epimerase [Opitutae bacterium]|nr:sugar phosphate isomerase/epimerase [Opitutae bacterium]